jgi:hypothetical protein
VNHSASVASLSPPFSLSRAGPCSSSRAGVHDCQERRGSLKDGTCTRRRVGIGYAGRRPVRIALLGEGADQNPPCNRGYAFPVKKTRCPKCYWSLGGQGPHPAARSPGASASAASQPPAIRVYQAALRRCPRQRVKPGGKAETQGGCSWNTVCVKRLTLLVSRTRTTRAGALAHCEVMPITGPDISVRPVGDSLAGDEVAAPRRCLTGFCLEDWQERIERVDRR